MIDKIRMHDQFVQLNLLNALYEDSEAEPVKSALTKSIAYTLNELVRPFLTLHTDYKDGKMFPPEFDNYLRNYNLVFTNNTALECYRSHLLDIIKREIAERNIN